MVIQNQHSMKTAIPAGRTPIVPPGDRRRLHPICYRQRHGKFDAMCILEDLRREVRQAKVQTTRSRPKRITACHTAQSLIKIKLDPRTGFQMPSPRLHGNRYKVLQAERSIPSTLEERFPRTHNHSFLEVLTGLGLCHEIDHRISSSGLCIWVCGGERHLSSMCPMTEHKHKIWRPDASSKPVSWKFWGSSQQSQRLTQSPPVFSSLVDRIR